MFSRLQIHLRNYASTAGNTLKQRLSHGNLWRRARLPLLAGTIYSMLPSSLNIQEEKAIDLRPVNRPLAVSKPMGLVSIVWEALLYFSRFLQLMLIFSPPILLSPLLFFKRTEDYWMNLFVKSVQRAGVVFIKTFQYLSHRRDIIGPELSAKFGYLRQKVPTHSYETTCKLFKEGYGQNISEVFDEFDPVPIASGSVSQVYQAKYKGNKVAVKVRHPGVDVNIERDIDLMFMLSRAASYFSPSYEIPISHKSLKKTFTDQLDFITELQNLKTFNKMFKGNKDVKFPHPFVQSTKQEVLVESFVEGVPVSFFESNRHPLNKIIARQGSEAFFEMLMKNNFIHADCHGGNIFIAMERPKYNFFTEIWNAVRDFAQVLQLRVKAQTVDSETLRELYLHYCRQQTEIRKLRRKQRERIIINMLDAGMVIKLEEQDKKTFVRFIKSVIEGRGRESAQMIYDLSSHEGVKLTEKERDLHHSYLEELNGVFGVLDQGHYLNLAGMDLFHNMMAVIRKNKMKLEGEFATLLTNIIVLEGMAREIDPEINILTCAFPYFKYVEDVALQKRP